MTFQIQAVTIYGKQPGQMNVVPFKTGALNIVTGDSRRGKSALLTIIDYCLASSDYPVKAGKVRDYVSAYAITLSKPGQQLFVARRAPEGKAVSTVMCVLTQTPGAPPPILEELRFSTPGDVARGLLSDFCGIDNTVRVPAVGKNTLIAPSVRHALFFCFQAQNEVANPDVLFHSQGEDWKPNTIRGVIPYFLGAVDRDQALLQNKLRNLRRDLADNEAVIAVSADLTPASGQVQALLTEAVEAGLLPPQTGELTADVVLQRLRNAMTHGFPEPGLADDDPFAALNSRRAELRRLFAQTRAQIADLKVALAENNDFNDQAFEQRARLTSLGLLNRDAEASGQERCPVCDSRVPSANDTIAGLMRDVAHLDGDLQAIGSDTPAIQRLLVGHETRLQELRSELARNQDQTRELTTAMRTIQREPDDLRRSAIVQGRISLYLDTAAQHAAAPRVLDRREGLREQIAELEEQLSGSTQDERLTSFLSLINQEIKEKAGTLDLDFSDSPIRLDINRLTVIADTLDGPVQLKNMGSAENHLGYHVSTLLSLHEWFTRHSSPIPRVLILDQPSQVYFPAEPTGEEDLQTNDRMHLLNIFQALHHTLEQLDGRMQIIVMEHADLDDPAFSNHVVQRWRYGNDSALVPSSWMAPESGS
ncbi:MULTISPECIES: DUF3732 domain-containing protein [unclassified Streptomyces]|uniref:DUF3732 domain-containing protein n=1 Tax=unclassified Streptomyces TaxID=2593676 RepID=UPI00344BEA49